MALVLVDLRRPDPDGTRPAAGAIDFRPTARRTIDTHIVLPAAFSAQLVDGQASVELAPTGADWCWRVTERVRGLATSTTRHVLVPDVDVAHYAHLADVDPASLEPAPDALAGWVETLAEVERIRDEIRAFTVVTYLGDGIYQIGES